ncbi:autotransporter domain-containing protein [Alienimonas sp. DA493]|uniref:autotransporter outer membrane beta-barrel domain-containing protein n=1 Tax=Alienimonas sp. DA493 TaxID=3373605 RepID=UPI003753EEDF
MGRPAPRPGRPPGSRRGRRALPWLPAAAFALGALPTVAVGQDRTVSAPLSVTAEESTAQDTQVAAGGSVTVTGTGWLKAEDFVTNQNVSVEAGGLLTTQAGGAAGGAFTGNGNYAVTGGTTAVGGRLFVGSTRDLSGAGATPPANPADGPTGTLVVSGGAANVSTGGTISAGGLTQTGGPVTADGGRIDLFGAATVDGGVSDLTAENGGTITGTTLAVTNGGDVQSTGGGSTLTLSGVATVDGAGSLLVADGGGAFSGTALGLTGGGAAVADGAGSRFALTGAATVDGERSDLFAQNGGAFEGTTLALSDKGDAVVTGVGSTFVLSGAATVEGVDSDLISQAGGDFDGVTLALADRGDARVTGAGSTFTLTGGATVDSFGSLLTSENGGAFEGTTLDLTNAGHAFVTGAGSTFALSGAATVDGAGSLLTSGNGGAFGGTALALTDGGRARVLGSGSTFALSGAATVDGAGSALIAEDGGALTADSATQTDGFLVVRSGSSMTFANDLTVDGGETYVDGSLTAAHLLLNSGGLLTGAGTITGDLIASGRIAVGNSPGAMVVNGNYVGAGQTFDVEVRDAAAPVAGTDYDQLAVTGTATVDGGTVNVAPFGSHGLAVGTRYDFLTAAGGLTVVTPVTVNENLPAARFVQLIRPNSYALVVARADTRTVAETFNQRAVAGALVGGAPALVTLRDALDTLGDAEARAALDGLSGELYGTQLTALNRSNLQFLDVVSRGGAFPSDCGTCGADRSGWIGTQGWAKAFGAGGRVESDGNAAEADLGNAGLTVGVGQVFGGPDACLAADLFYGYESITVRVPDVRSSATDEIHRVGGSLRASAGNTYARLTGFAGGSDGEARRAFAVDNPLFPLSDRTTADVSGSLAAGDAELGQAFGSPAAYLSPVVGLRYVRVDRDGFTENGGVTALRVEDSTLEEFRARIGLRAGRRLATGLPATGTFEAFYSRELLAGTVGDYRAAFAAAPAAVFEARGTDFDADRLTLAPGLSIGEGPVRLSGQYRAGLSETAVLHGGEVRLELCF